MENVYSINPNLDLNLAFIHNFVKDNHLIKNYCVLQKKYYIVLELYLKNKLGLLECEDKLNSCGYFVNHKDKIISTLNIENISLSYFFIRNNLNIEVLSIEEMNTLIISSDINELLKLVENTFLKVIKVNFLYGQKVVNSKLLYDGTGSDFLKNNNSLIIGFIDDLTGKKVSDDEWDIFSYKRDQIKNDIFEKLEKICFDKLNCKVEFIEYSLDLLNNLKK